MRLRDKIARRMVELAGDEASPWTALESRYGATVRRTWERETPEHTLGQGFGRWPEPTYRAHVFLTMVAGKVIMGIAPAPWVRRLDREIPLWLAEAILEEPELGLDTVRQLDMRDARKAARAAR